MTTIGTRLKAGALMRRDVAYVSPDTTLVELAAFLDENRIHGAPVKGPRNELLGIVSRTDLARAMIDGASTEAHLTWFRMLDDSGEFEGSWTDLDPDTFPGAETTVGEIMSTKVVTAGIDWTAGRVAEEMVENGVHRVLVVDDGTVAGILSSTDLLRAVVDYEGRLAH